MKDLIIVVIVAILLGIIGVGSFNYGKLSGTQATITEFNNANLQNAYQEGGKAGYVQCQKDLTASQTK